MQNVSVEENEHRHRSPTHYNIKHYIPRRIHQRHSCPGDMVSILLRSSAHYDCPHSSDYLSGSRHDTTDHGLRRPSGDLLEARKEHTECSVHLAATCTRPLRPAEARDAASNTTLEPSTTDTIIVEETGLRDSLVPFWSMLALSGIHTLKQTFTRSKWCNVGLQDTPATTSATPVASLSSKLQQIGWDTLQERRSKSRLTMQFRMAHDLIEVPADDHLQTYNSRGGNAANFHVPYRLANKHSFFQDVTRMWKAHFP